MRDEDGARAVIADEDGGREIDRREVSPGGGVTRLVFQDDVPVGFC